MENTMIKRDNVMAWLRRLTLAVVAGLFSVGGVMAQNSLPAPGTGGSFNPAPVGGGNPGGGPGWNGGPRPGFGNNGIGWNPGPGFNNPGMAPGWNNPGWNNPGWQNQGTVTVMACGYDAQGNWCTLPLHVAYTYNGFVYDVTVLNAWNPWSNTWNVGVDMPAYNTSYYTHGQTYNFYAPLSTGTYYFNL